MTIIDLSTPSPQATSLLESLPRRVTLTLTELQLVAELAAGAPLPFDVVPFDVASPDDARATESRAYRAAHGALHPASTTLERRGLIVDGTLDEHVAGAVGLLATPTYALDLDVRVGDVHVKAWHRASGDAVATLATADGLVFELAWFPLAAWPGELSRVGVLPEDLVLRASAVPAYLDLPYELADAAIEAAADSRSDLVPVLTAQHADDVLDAEGRAFPVDEVPRLLKALDAEAQGRLRVLVADVSSEPTSVVGVRSWVLLADGWRTVHPRARAGTSRVVLRAVDASELAADLAPVLAQVAS